MISWHTEVYCVVQSEGTVLICLLFYKRFWPGNTTDASLRLYVEALHHNCQAGSCIGYISLSTSSIFLRFFHQNHTHTVYPVRSRVSVSYNVIFSFTIVALYFAWNSITSTQTSTHERTNANDKVRFLRRLHCQVHLSIYIHQGEFQFSK